MASVRKLKSGHYQARVFSHTEPNGKKKYVSFVASTKEEAKMQASKWENSKHRTGIATNKTVSQCIDDYITIKTKVLAPSTIRTYRNMQKKYYKELANVPICKLTNADAQGLINNLIGKVSEKSIKNIYALFTTSIKFCSKDIVFNVTLPKKKIIEDIKEIENKQAPSNDDVILLYKMASPWLKKCIALAAFSGMRRGEIAALKYKDILRDRNKIFIHKAFSMNEYNKWVLKEPKTEGSVRLANIPQEVIELLGDGDPEEFIIGYNPNTISKMFIKLRKRFDVDIRFHDLRHYFASIGNVLGIPDVTLADFAGWEHNSPIIKDTYQDKVKDISEGYAKKMNNYFSDLINNGNKKELF
jgi:integrase